MEEEKNASFVAHLADSSTVWDFKVLPSQSSGSNLEESVYLVEQLLTSFNGVLRPLQVEYLIRDSESNSEQTEAINKTIESPEGVSFEYIRDEMQQCPNCGSKIIKKITFSQAETMLKRM